MSSKAEELREARATDAELRAPITMDRVLELVRASEVRHDEAVARRALMCRGDAAGPSRHLAGARD